jgi:hypothetical protein
LIGAVVDPLPEEEKHAMDYRNFDDLTRLVVVEGGTRRTLLQLLTGGAFASAAARLGLTEDAAAKAKKHRTERKRKHKPQAEVNHQDQLQTEGKRKKRRNKRDKELPQEPDIPLEPLVPGCPAGQWDCGGGHCVAQDQCCPGERACPGGSCVSKGVCCPGEKLCTGYSECFAEDDCCPNAVPPLCNACQNVVCEHGGLVCKDRPDPGCSACQQKTCEGGTWVCKPGHQEYCPAPNWVWDYATCRCVCTEDYVDCGVHWNGYAWVGKCSCEVAGGRNYCNEARGICCSTQNGCDS